MSKKVPFSYRHRRTWPRLMKWLSMKIVVIQPHSCMRLREGFFPHWSILNGHFTISYFIEILFISPEPHSKRLLTKRIKNMQKYYFFLSKYTYQCHFRWPISWTRPYHRIVRPVRTIWHVIRIQPFGLRSSFFSSFLFLDFCAFWICFFRFWNWKREKRRITSHHSHPRKNAINLLMLIAPKPEHFGFYFYLWHFLHVMKIILICNNIKYYVDKVGYFEDISFWIGQWVFLNGTAWMEIPQKSFLRIVTSQSAIFTIQ